MKYLINISFTLSVLILILTGCVKENYDITPDKEYSVGFAPTHYIADLKEMYPTASIIEEDIIIRGTVISNDSLGNFYKELVIQDSTGGIEIQIDMYDIYKGYPVGKMVFVKCKGLIISNYHGVKQLTYLSNGSSQRLPEGVLKDYLFRSDEGIPIEPKLMKISELSEEHINTIIKVEDVQFISDDLDSTFANPSEDMNRTVTDIEDNLLITRNSRYAEFADEKVPSGNGSIIGVYAMYDDDKQMNIRDNTELDMTGPRFNYLVEEDFETDINNFTAYSVIGAQVWYWDFYDDGCAVMNGYAGSAQENEDWLISPSFNLSSSTLAQFTFSHAVGFFTSWNDAEIFISSDYDGSSDPSTNGTWTEVTDFNKPVDWDFVNSGSISLANYIGNSSVYVAFKYTSSTSDAMSWEVGSVKVISQ